jgi:acetyl-CoA carboxylase carboxyltransferase component
MPFEKQIQELERRRTPALQMGGEDKIKKQKEKGRFTARERIDKLLDPGSFLEIGMFNHSDMPGMEEKIPADSKVAGYGKIDGRPVVIISNDFTVRWLLMPHPSGLSGSITFTTLSTRDRPGIIFTEHWR